MRGPDGIIRRLALAEIHPSGHYDAAHRIREPVDVAEVFCAAGFTAFEATTPATSWLLFEVMYGLAFEVEAEALL